MSWNISDDLKTVGSKCGAAGWIALTGQCLLDSCISSTAESRTADKSESTVDCMDSTYGGTIGPATLFPEIYRYECKEIRRCPYGRRKRGKDNRPNPDHAESGQREGWSNYQLKPPTNGLGT